LARNGEHPSHISSLAAVTAINTAPGIASIHDSANRPYFKTTTGDLLLPFDLSYELDVSGGVRRTVAVSREKAQAAAADLESISLSLHAELAFDYFELRGADAQKQLLDDTVKAYQDALQLTTNRFEGGAALKSDVAQARTQLETRWSRIRTFPWHEHSSSTPLPS
jgi:outer membrane protein TolC